MSRRCQITGKSGRAGNNVSHSNVKTRRRFEPNIQQASLYSEALGRSFTLRVSTRALRSVTKRGGLDAFLRGEADARLAPDALAIKRKVQKALRG